MKYSLSTSFKLYAHCVVVNGVKRSTISNLERGRYELIPNSFYVFIKKFEGVPLEKILSRFAKKNHVVLFEYLDFLENGQYAFFTETPINFPRLKTNWHSPSIITNAIIDIGNEPLEIEVYEKIINQLAELLCQVVQIRVYTIISYKFIINLLKLDWRGITDIQLFLKYEGFDKIKLSEMYDSNIRISFVCLHSSISEKVEHLSKGNLQNVYHIKSRLTDATHCGNILKSYFSINMETYLESLSFNSCLNRKVGIDEKGNVKNCPSLSKIYGNVLEDSICELVLRTDFQEAWMIKKDDIADCKICEFRHMCTDCRLGDKGAFEKSKKPKKCNYDPYSATWN